MLVLTAIIGVLAYTQLGSVSGVYNDVATQDAMVLATARDADAAQGQMQSAARGYSSDQDQHELTNYTENRAVFQRDVAAIGRLALDEREAAAAASLREKSRAMVAQYDQVVALARAGSLERARTLEESTAERTAAAVMADTDRLSELAQSNMRAGTRSAESAASTARWIVLGLLLAALALGAVIAVAIARSITRPLGALNHRLTDIADGDGDLTQRVDDSATDELGQVGRVFNRFVGQIQDLVRETGDKARALARMATEMTTSSDQTGEAVDQIAATVEGVAKGSSEQAEALHGITGIMGDMAQGVGQVATSGEQAAHQAADADHQAADGAERLQDAEQAMARIGSSTGQVFEVVGQLDARSQAIGEIVGTITQIAGQTNLLALNAAIEAARAGEQGRGFAVVADEVRKLAEESQAAAGSIGDILGEIQAEAQRAVEAMRAGRQDVEEGARVVAAAGAAFTHIRAEVQQVATAVAAAAAAAQELGAESGEMQEKVSQVAAVAEENAAAAEEVASATEQTSASVQQVVATTHALQEASADLRALVERFRV